MKILSLSGFVPEQICDVIRFTEYSGNHKISHYCGYASDYISQVLNDNSIDGAVYPRSCDSSRVISSYLQESGKFYYQITVPARQDDVAVQFLAADIENYKNAVEKYYGVKIVDVKERTERINTRNKELKKLYENIESISYGAYLKAIHEMLQTPLWEQRVLKNIPKKNAENKRIYLVGSFLSNSNVADIVEKSGMTIVGDNLTESKRLFSFPMVEIGGDIYKNIATGILKNKLSPTQNRFEKILLDDLEEIKQKEVKGVIYITQKYCEPYDYMFSVYKKMLDKKGIPVLRVTLTDSTDNRKIEAILEAFADIL